MAKDPWTTTLFSWLRDVAKITRGLRELPYLETTDIERMVARAHTQWASYPLETVLDVDDPTSSPVPNELHATTRFDDDNLST